MIRLDSTYKGRDGRRGGQWGGWASNPGRKDGSELGSWQRPKEKWLEARDSQEGLGAFPGKRVESVWTPATEGTGAVVC